MENDVEMANREEKCLECYWFVQSPSGEHGYCKSLPPVFTGSDEKGRAKFFNPVVSPYSFCSMFEEI